MSSFSLFTDVSLHPHRRLGVGAYFFVASSFLQCSPDSIERSAVAEKLRTRRFEETSSTKLEIQTVLWALESCQNKLKVSPQDTLHIYSDSQCVSGLLTRRRGLEAIGFIGKRSKLPLKNAALYCKFYEFYDTLDFKIIKVTGHSPSCSHDTAHRIFSCVDKEVRKEFNVWMDELMADSIDSGTTKGFY